MNRINDGKTDFQGRLWLQVVRAGFEGGALGNGFAVKIDLKAILGFHGGEVMPAGGQLAVVGGALAGLEGKNMARGECTAEEFAIENCHGPRAAEAYLGRLVELANIRPFSTTVEAVHIGQRQRAGVEFAVVNGHAHHFLLVAEPAIVGPLLWAIEGEYGAGGPSAHAQAALVDGHGIGLCAVGHRSKALPVFAATVFKEATGIVTEAIQCTVVCAKMDHAQAGTAAVGPFADTVEAIHAAVARGIAPSAGGACAGVEFATE